MLVPKAIGELHQRLPTTRDPPERRPVRQLLDRNLAPVAIQHQEHLIRAIAIELIEDIAPRGRCDFQTDFAAHFPIRVFMGMVDLPAADAPKLKHWTDQAKPVHFRIGVPRVELARYRNTQPPADGSYFDLDDDLVTRTVRECAADAGARAREAVVSDSSA